MRIARTENKLLLATWLLAIAVIVFPFAPLLFDASVSFVERDILRSFLPGKFFWLNTLRTEGALPTWNPFIYNGHPYWADLKSGVLNPFHLTLLFFSPAQIHYAFTWFIFVHFPVMGYGMHRALRSMGFEKEPAILFALLFALSGTVISSICMPNLLAGQAILPYFLWFYTERGKDSGRPLAGHSFGLMACLALPIYCATPEFAYFFSLALTAQWLARPSRESLLALGWIGIGSLALAAAQLLPALESFLHAKRFTEAFSAEEVNNFRFHPSRIREIFLALPFGNYEPKAVNWSVFQSSTFFYSPYAGAGLTFALGALLPAAWRENRRPAVGMALLVLGALVLSFGPYAPVDLYQICYRYFPGWKLFRYPEKMLIPLGLLLLLLQAMGWRNLLADTYGKTKDLTLRCALAIFLLAAAALFYSVAIFPTEAQRAVGFASLRHYLVCGALMIALLAALKKWPAIRPYRWLLLLVILGHDLGTHARALLWEEPVAAVHAATVDKILANLHAREAEIRHGAAFRYSSLAVVDQRPFLKEVPGIKLDMVGRLAQSVAYHVLPAYSVLNGIADVSGAGALPNGERMKLWRELSQKNPRRMLNLLGARYVAGYDTPEFGELKIQGNLAALPYIFFPRELLLFAEKDSVADALLAEGFREHEQLAVKSEQTGRLVNFAGASAEILEKRTDFLRVRITGGKVAQARVVSVGESFDRHWRASVNGQPAPLRLANGWAMAVDLGPACAADCVLELRYFHPWIPVGILITLGFVFFSFLALRYAPPRKRRSLP